MKLTALYNFAHSTTIDNIIHVRKKISAIRWLENAKK